MKEIIFNRKDYKTYKDFYAQIYKDLNGKSFGDWEDYNNLNYNPNMLDEFLWYNHNKNLKFIFIGFNLEEIKKFKTCDDYEFKMIFEVIQDFIEKHPNNSIEIINE